MTDVKRTIAPQITSPGAQPDLPGMPPQGWGVGNHPPHPSRQGGGYLSICMPFEFSIPEPQKKNFGDPRIGQLEIMGLPRIFIDVAEAIGFEAFMAMWKIFDGDPSLREQGPSAMRIVMRPFGAWERYERNRYVEHLFASGLTDAEVMQRLETQLGTELHDSSMRRLRLKTAGRDKAPQNHVARHSEKR